MNGEDKKILSKLLEEKFKNLHSQIDELKEDVKPLKNLDCEVHREKIQNNEKWISTNRRIYIFGIVIIVVGGVMINLFT